MDHGNLLTFILIIGLLGIILLYLEKHTKVSVSTLILIFGLGLLCILVFVLIKKIEPIAKIASKTSKIVGSVTSGTSDLTSSVSDKLKPYINGNKGHQIIQKLKNMLVGVIPQKYLDLPVVPSGESFTYNKKKIHLCVGDFDINTLMYVYLHELAHAMTSPEDSQENAHGDVWKANFDKILNDAQRAGVYNKNIKFDKKYMEVCGKAQ